jgi:hypothetical protein
VCETVGGNVSDDASFSGCDVVQVAMWVFERCTVRQLRRGARRGAPMVRISDNALEASQRWR